NRLEGDALPLPGEPGAVVRLVGDQAPLREALQHRGGGRGRHPEALGHRVGMHGPVAAPLQVIDRLRVVLCALIGAPLRVRMVASAGAGGTLRAAHQTLTSRLVAYRIAAPVTRPAMLSG